LQDAIKHIPSYAELLKDLCILKHKMRIQKKAFHTKHVCFILQNNSSPKYTDPSCPTISCITGNFRIEKALLDLGASVNLLRHSKYEQLYTGVFKPTKITLKLAHRLVKVTREVVVDVLVQVGKFYFPVDFIVLDGNPIFNDHTQILVILGRPFLATSNAIINYRNGPMVISFGNTTMELD